MAFEKFWRSCEGCKQEFLVKYAHRPDQRFCSLTCAGRWSAKTRLARHNDIRAQRAHEEKMAVLGRTKDDVWRALMDGRTFDAVKIKPSPIPYQEPMPEGAREL